MPVVQILRLTQDTSLRTVQSMHSSTGNQMARNYDLTSHNARGAEIAERNREHKVRFALAFHRKPTPVRFPDHRTPAERVAYVRMMARRAFPSWRCVPSNVRPIRRGKSL